MVRKVINADAKNIQLNLRGLIATRSFLVTLAKRDVKVKYAQTFLGILWSILQPLVNLLIFTVFFTVLLKIDTGNVPYILFAFSGIVCWQYFSNLVISSGQALIQNQHLISKVYFPRLHYPLSKVVSELVDFLISLFLLIATMLFLGYSPGWQLVFFPFLILMMIIVALSIGIWVSALSIRYRDVHQLMPNVIRIGMWITPVFYPVSIIPENYRDVLYLNPVAGIVDGIRWCLFGTELPSYWFLVSFFASLVLLVSGLYYFRKVESKIADFI